MIGSLWRAIVRFCDGVEEPTRQRAFGAVLAVAVLVDLSAYELARFNLWEPHRFHMPWLPLWPALEPTAENRLLMYGMSFLACIGANALFWGRRWGAWAMLIVYSYLFLDHQPNYTNNGFLLLIMLGVAGASNLRRPTPIWPRRVGQIALSTLYLGAGLAKLDEAFLSGSILDQALTRYGYRYEAWIGVHDARLLGTAAWATMLLELCLAAGLWFPRTHRVLVPLGLAFHASIEILMPVRFFWLLSAAGYVLFLDAAALHSLIARVRAIARPATWLMASVISIVSLQRPWYGVSPSGAAIVAVATLLGLLLFRRPVYRSEAPTPRPRAPSVAAVGAVGAMLAIQLFCLIKPALGMSKRFAWQMFSEALIMRVDTEVRSRDRYRSAVFPAAHVRWRREGYRYHWTSWSEERLYLAGYAQWLADTHAIRDVRVVAHYRVNGDAERVATFIGHNPHGDPL